MERATRIQLQMDAQAREQHYSEEQNAYEWQEETVVQEPVASGHGRHDRVPHFHYGDAGGSGREDQFDDEQVGPPPAMSPPGYPSDAKDDEKTCKDLLYYPTDGRGWRQGGSQETWYEPSARWSDSGAAYRENSWRQDPWSTDDPWAHGASLGRRLHTRPAIGRGCEQGLYVGWHQGDSWSTHGAGWHQGGYANWKWPTQHHGWNDGSSSQGHSRGPPKHSLDRKDVAKPESYSGDINRWIQWRSTFSRYLGRQDERWPLVLKKIEGYKGKMISEDDEYQIDKEFNCEGIRPRKEQMMLALESFTSGETRRIINIAEEQGVFSSWSRLADKGHSLRDEHVMTM